MPSKDQIARYISRLEEQGVSRKVSAPPLYRLIWRLGVDVAPPFNQSLLGNTFFLGSFFAVLFGILMWLFHPQQPDKPTEAAILSTFIGGAIFGVCMAFYYRFKSRSVDVPKWPPEDG